MDGLIKKDDSMMISHEPFVMQTDVQNFMDMDAALSAYLASEPVKLPMVQTCKIPANNALFERSLTARETEVLEMLGKGLSVKGAARELNISPGTVKWHVKNLYYKLGASSREDALNKARIRRFIG